MTQKDIAFVADFLSEHFSEVRSPDDTLMTIKYICSHFLQTEFKRPLV